MTPLAGRKAVTTRLAAALVVAALAAACGGPPAASSGSAPGAGPGVTVLARDLPQLGTVLVTSKGYALYMFVPDAQRQVTCTGLCAATWPPVKISPAARLSAGPGVRAGLLGSDPDPAGGRVVTYDGWPLYTYTGDVRPGQATGQGIDLNGGDWYLMRVSGKPLATGPA